MKYNNKIQIGFLLRNYRLKGGFYVKDKKVYNISSLLCHRFAIKNKHEDQERKKKMEQKNTQQQRRLKNRRIDLSSWCEHPFLLKIVLRVVNIPFCFVFENNFVLKASNFRINLAFSAVACEQAPKWGIGRKEK